MPSFRMVGEILNDRRNWPVIVIAGLAVFIGSLIFDALNLDSAIWTVILIVVIALVARPFIKPNASD